MPVTVNFNYSRTIRSARPRRLVRTSDGDTPVIEQPIRMVSCDTPEKGQYAGNPPVSQPKLDTCRQRLQNGFYDTLPQVLRTYLISKLSNDAAQRHISAGHRASQEFDTVLTNRLTRPDGSLRSVAVIPTGELIDTYGRLLAYIAPWFSGSQSDPLPPQGHPDRRTINLDMIENGWAAFFPIYPSLPRNDDMNRAIAAAEVAWNQRRGVWAEFGDTVLLGYEFRMCIKLGTAPNQQNGISEAFQRICVDLRNMSELGLFGFHAVPPCYRLWIWEDDIAQARHDLGLN
ncbi:MAG: thermonuclease family protein [Candidatus Binatia bacterium]